MRYLEFFILSCVFGSVLLLGYKEEGRDRPSQLDIWHYIQKQAAAVHLDPEFVYAVAMAESSLNPEADSGHARGIMQLTEPAWESVTTLPYSFAWDWRLNIRMGVLYLAKCREFLMESQAYSIGRLAACYRYGMHKVKENHFDVLYLPTPKNNIYLKLLREDEIPVKPPSEPYYSGPALYRDGENAHSGLRAL